MKRMLIKFLKVLGGIFVLLYLTVCILFYIYQEEYYVFVPQKLESSFAFDFPGNFEEVNIQAQDGMILNSLLFEADSSKGLIFYLHGNGGSLEIWGEKANFYTDLGYDVLMTDYRGFGKSEGSINSEAQLHEDVQTVYDEATKRYSEDSIIVLGYSLGSGLGTRLAANNNPKRLILQAPYYSISDAAEHLINTSDALLFKGLKLVPTTLLTKYKIKTNEFIQGCKVPIVIFHGEDDKLIYYGSSLKLQEYFKPGDELITLKGHDHFNFVGNKEYKAELIDILGN